MASRTTPSLLALAMMAALLGACATPIDPGYLALLEAPSVDGVQPPSSNTLGPSDKINIRVYNEDLGGEFVISPDGTVSFPYLGKVTVSGLTCSGVEDELMRGLAQGYLREPSVSCSVVERNSKKVSVFGEVKQPGNFLYEDRMSIIQAVTSAGGFTDRAAPDDTTLVRVVQGEKVHVRVPFDAILKGRVESLVLMPGDVIFVPKSLY